MRELTPLEKAIVFLDSAEGIEYKYRKFVIENFKGDFFGDEKNLLKFFDNNNLSVLGKSIAEMIKDKAYVEKRIASALSGADDLVTLHSVGKTEEYYPESLKATPAPPLALYLKGNKELLKAKYKVSIVGSRKTLQQYARAAEDISRKISINGAVVVSGIADGADEAAIKGALPSGNVISVTASGVCPVSPSGKQPLAEKIYENGLVISEYPHGYVPRNYSYPVRNRIIAALSPVTLIVSGNIKSGARYTAGYASDYGREIACFPYGLGVTSGELCKSLIKSGAAMVENAEELAALIGMPLKKEREIILNESEKAVYKSIKEGISSMDELSSRLKTGISELMTTTVSLEMKRLIAKGSDGRYYVT